MSLRLIVAQLMFLEPSPKKIRNLAGTALHGTGISFWTPPIFDAVG